MNAINEKTSRRAFVLNSGATLGAGVAAAASAGAAALPAAQPSAQQQLARQQDFEAIRQLHAQFIAAVESATRPGAVDTHRAYRANARQIEDALTLSKNQVVATASWHVDVQVVTPLIGESTVAQMARLQGMHESVCWEAGRLEARYQKARGQWQMTEVRYIAT